MKLAVISSSPFIIKQAQYHGYSPYIKEMAVWEKYATEIAFFCPIWETDRGLLIAPVPFEVSKIFEAKDFNIKTIPNALMAFLYSFWNGYQLIRTMWWADHIHLRCPGNLGLMGCLLQVFFPRKVKTAKYAGNWDPKSKQPWSYKLQQWILENTFLTRNMQVLVYGHWKGSSRNIKSFFTATYTEAEKIPVEPRQLNKTLMMIFAGTLSAGKQPLYAIQLAEALREKHPSIQLSLYGNGDQKELLQQYIDQHQLTDSVLLKGNFSQEAMKPVYQQAHFLVLPSKSEGWPKVVAEAMFWGCMPLATKVSCVPDMLDQGRRGMLLSMNLAQDVEMISGLIQDPSDYTQRVQNGIDWSRKYTLDLFDQEIKSLLQ